MKMGNGTLHDSPLKKGEGAEGAGGCVDSKRVRRWARLAKRFNELWVSRFVRQPRTAARPRSRSRRPFAKGEFFAAPVSQWEFLAELEDGFSHFSNQLMAS